MLLVNKGLRFPVLVTTEEGRSPVPIVVYDGAVVDPELFPRKVCAAHVLNVYPNACVVILVVNIGDKLPELVTTVFPKLLLLIGVVKLTVGLCASSPLFVIVKPVPAVKDRTLYAGVAELPEVLQKIPLPVAFVNVNPNAWAVIALVNKGDKSLVLFTVVDGRSLVPIDTKLGVVDDPVLLP